MKAADIMVTKVITVDADTRVQEIAALLLANRISAVPVLDKAGTLIGIVSEGDLMRRPESGTEKKHAPWLEFISSPEALAREYIKSHAREAKDVMTRDVVTVAPETPVAEIAGMLEKRRIKRVPVVENGKVVGIVSRSNLLQALATLKDQAPRAAADDNSIREHVLTELGAQPWTRPSLLNVTVHDGVVDLWGLVDTEVERKAVCVLAEATPGVRAVNDNLTVFRLVSGA